MPSAFNRPGNYCPARQRSLGAASRCSPPLMQRGDSMATPCKGGLSSQVNDSVWFCRRVRKPPLAVPTRDRHAANPSVGIRRQLPLHKGGPVAGRAQCLGSHTLLAVLHPTGPFCGTLRRLHPSPFRCWLASAGAGKPAAHDAGDRNGCSVTLPRGSFPFLVGR